MPGFGPGWGFAPLSPSGAPNQIVLKPGQPQSVPTDDTSRFRIRALEKTGVFTPLRSGELLFTLQIQPEPSLQCQNILSVKVESAVDNKGQKLSPPVGETPASAEQFPGALLGPGAVPPALAFAPVNLFGNSLHYAAVRLKEGGRGARTLKELKGTVTAQVLTPPEPVVTADNLLQAAGKTFKGTQGGALKILEVTRGEKDRLTVRLELDCPANVVTGNEQANGLQFQMAPQQARVIRRQGRVAVQKQVAQPGAPGQVQVQIQFQFQGAAQLGVGQSEVEGSLYGLALQDAQGKVLPSRVSRHLRGSPNGVVREYRLTYQPQQGQGTPAKLVFSGQRSATIDIPFTLNDVPLP